MLRPFFFSRFFTALVFVLISGGAIGCTIPVFRYALDRWEPDAFELLLPASAVGDTALNQLLRPLRANGKANLKITNSTDASLTAATLRTARLGGQSLWSGPLDATQLDLILDSPARRQIIEKILAGDSVIWVIADDGSPAESAEADRIAKRLQFLQNVAALPIQDPNDPDSQLGPGPPLLLQFTTLRLRRDDPSEALLLKMLAGPSAEVDPLKQSFAAAVFGRGRVLGAWPLSNLDNTALEDACMFLVGRCSCRVKDQNPGWDILLNVDWDQALRQTLTPPTTAAVPTPALPSPDTVQTAPESPDSTFSQSVTLSPEGLVHEVKFNSSEHTLHTSTTIFPSWQLISIAALLAIGAAFVFFSKKS